MCYRTSDYYQCLCASGYTVSGWSTSIPYAQTCTASQSSDDTATTTTDANISNTTVIIIVVVCCAVVVTVLIVLIIALVSRKKRKQAKVHAIEGDEVQQRVQY